MSWRVGVRGKHSAIDLLSKVNKKDLMALTLNGSLFHKCAPTVAETTFQNNQ